MVCIVRAVRCNCHLECLLQQGPTLRSEADRAPGFGSPASTSWAHALLKVHKLCDIFAHAPRIVAHAIRRTTKPTKHAPARRETPVAAGVEKAADVTDGDDAVDGTGGPIIFRGLAESLLQND